MLESIAAPLAANPPVPIQEIRAACIKVSAYLETTTATRESMCEAEAVGVRVWNASVQAKSSRASPCLETLARLRGVALQLVEFGLGGGGGAPGVDVRRRLLALAVAAGKAFADSGDDDSADAAFERAGRYAAADADAPAALAAVARDSAVLAALQAELVWRTDKADVAFLLVNRACAPRLLQHLTIREIDRIVASCTKMSQLSEHTQASVQWLKIALNLLESIAESEKTRQRANEVLLNLASEYLILQNFELSDKIAFALLQKTTGLMALACIQLRLKSLQQRNITDPTEYIQICHILQQTVSMVNAKPELIELFLSILHSVAPVSLQSALSLADWIISQNANIPDKVSLFEKVFLTKIHLLTASGSGILTEDALARVKEVIQSIGSTKGGSVSKDTARMAQLVVWKCGETAMLQHCFEDAVDWFLVALKLVTGATGDDRNMAILYRKMALSYVQLKKYSEALDACKKASLFKDDLNSMATVYIQFLIYLEQELTDLAEESLAQMAQLLRDSGDKDKVLSFLLGAMDRSFKCGNQKLLKRILQTVLLHDGFEDVEFWRRTMLVVVRCLIRLSVATDVNELTNENYDEILRYVGTAIKSLGSWKHEVRDSDVLLPNLEAEISWMGKTCWNLGIKSAPQFPAVSSRFFSFAAQAMKMEAEPLPETLTNRKLSVYIALFGEIELARVSGQSAPDHVTRAKGYFEDLSQIYIDIASLDSVASPKDQIYYKIIVLEYELILLEYSTLCTSKAVVFEAIKACIARATDEDFPLESFQRMADLAVTMNAPSNIVFLTVQTALGVMMKKQTDLNLVQFAQWFRLMVSSQVEGSKIDLYKQAAIIIKSTGKNTMYPTEEIQWLQFTAWNNGCDFFSAGDKNNAILWCDMAFKLSEFLPEEFASQIEDMRQSYAEILNEE
ncbi:hypothetical protein BDR26DRAFT_920545 [Obelidium mucronatum]|nr:hypothetical protein BDR26DRAFT_920545 [Obelidium mucronatum]